MNREPTEAEIDEAGELLMNCDPPEDPTGVVEAIIMQRNDLAALLRETCAVIGEDHICQTRHFDGSDCGRCFSCACGQLRQHIDAALGEPDMTKIAEAFKRTGDGVTVQVDEQPCATCGGHKLVKAPVLGILVSCPSCGEQAGGAE